MARIRTLQVATVRDNTWSVVVQPPGTVPPEVMAISVLLSGLATDGVISGISIANNGTVTVTRTEGGDLTANFSTAINALIAAADISDGQIPSGIARDAEVTASFNALATMLASTYAALAGAVFTGAVSGITPTADEHLANKAYVDDAVAAGGGTPMPTDDFYFGTSLDETPEGAELTIAGVNGSGLIPAYTGTRRLLIARLATEDDITSVIFSDDQSNTNQVGAFTKFGSTVIPTGETEAFNVWVSNQDLIQPTDVTVSVN